MSELRNRKPNIAPPNWSVEPNTAARLASSLWAKAQGLPARFYSVWCSAATVDPQGRPRSRILHPIWQWDGARLVGWIATGPTPTKRAHLAAHPYMSVNYWAPAHDTCVAECRATLVLDDATRTMVWDLFRNGPAPVGYDPAIVPGWERPTADAFAALRLEPWRLRVFPGTVLLRQGGSVLTWQE